MQSLTQNIQGISFEFNFTQKQGLRYIEVVSEIGQFDIYNEFLNYDNFLKSSEYQNLERAVDAASEIQNRGGFIEFLKDFCIINDRLYGQETITIHDFYTLLGLRFLMG